MELVATWEQQREAKRAKLSPLSRLSKNVSLYIVIFFTTIQMTLSGFAVPLTAYGVGALIAFFIARTGRRWAPLPSALWAGTLMVILGNEIIFDLTHPAENKVLFVFAAAIGAGLLVALPAGIAATVQNYLRAPAERRAPRWIRGALLALGGICLGASLVTVSLENRVDLTAGISPETLTKLPAVTSAALRFTEEELRFKAGQLVALRLDNFDIGVHSFDIDAFNVHAPMPVEQSGLAMFTPTQPGTYEFYCGIPGHREVGMVGTLIVEP